MAQRGKRINKNDNDLASCPGAIKRRKCRLGPTATGVSAVVSALGPSEEEETMAASSSQGGGASWTPRPLGHSDIKISSIYNRSTAEAPAELFRKDLISAMKLPDSEPLSPNEYWVITDQWKQEWERGVQVPVNPDSLPEPVVTITQPPNAKLNGDFKLPKKFIRISRDDYFNPEEHHLSATPSRAEKACAYDLDDTDIAWLDVLNGERAQAGQLAISESQLERVIEELEVRCWERIQTIVKNEEGLGIEYDENVICDVCRSPDSEEGNEMVFCDFCNICVHQACYGITSIPDGSWLCRTCSLSQRPDCVLCPNKGGAMKCTRSGQKWAHVSCALWIPEVSIGCVERMEPITKISSIPQSRWALICVLCRERVGACIQCSIKTCKTAYHVTCAFKYGLEMKAIIEDDMADDGVKLRSYCQKHSRTNTKDKVGVGGSSTGDKAASDSEDGESRKRKRKDMTSEEKNQARAAKLQEIEAEFDKHVSLKDITSQQLDVDTDAIIYIYNYWKLKRRAGHNKPLLAPRCGELSSAGARAQGQAADLEKMRTFVQLRQDLERVRNLCYMVNRREKLCRTFLKLREQTFHKQALVLSGPPLPPTAAAAVAEANHGPSIYDRLYSHSDAEDHTQNFDTIVARIAGIKSPTPISSDEKKKPQPDFNGASNKKLYFNGSVRRKGLCSSDLSSLSSSEVDTAKPTVTVKSTRTTINRGGSNNKTKVKIESESSTEDEVVVIKTSTKISRRRTKKASAPNRPRPCSSDSDKHGGTATKSRTLEHMERELGSASGSDDSDELFSLNTSSSTRVGSLAAAAIYSDTDSDSQERTSVSAPFISKAAVKEFSAADISKNSSKTFGKESKDESVAEVSNKENVKTKKKEKEYIPSALIVPQRQAAKKASEIMQRSQNKKEIVPESSEPLKSPIEDNKNIKQKEKPIAKKQKEPKGSKESKNNDIYDFDKDFGDGTEILAYVPQRQAAKKAAEHIKSGLGTKSIAPEPEVVESKAKKDYSENKVKKEISKKEEVPKKSLSESKTSSSTNSDSSSSNSCSSSSDSSSDSDDVKSPTQRSPKKKNQSSSTTSSESDTSNNSNKVSSNKRQNSSRTTTTATTTSDDAAESADKKTMAAGRKLKKLPDKKLKTSDGRHGSEFPPPPTERKEPSRTSVSKDPNQSRQSITKKTDQRSNNSSSKKLLQQQQQQQQPRVHQQTTSSHQDLLSGSRDNDGPRNISRVKPVKKTQPVKSQAQAQQRESQQQQQSSGKCKKEEEISTPTKIKVDTRKRKSSEVQQKEDKTNKNVTPVRKNDKRIEKQVKEKETVENSAGKPVELEKIVHSVDIKPATEEVSHLINESNKQSQLGSPKNDDKKKKGQSNKSPMHLLLLEEEIKQRRAERESPKKSSKSLDKFLEKHLDKHFKAKSEKEVNDQQVEKETTRHDNKLNQANEEHKNHTNKETSLPWADKSDVLPEKEIEKAPEDSEIRKKENKFESTGFQSVSSPRSAVPIEKEAEDSGFHKPQVVSGKTVNESRQDKDNHKRKKSINRSIFSPQHGQSKDPSVSELFDFDQVILNDDMVNDDGFSIPRDPEERQVPLSFSFNNELWFKEDTKEDSARDTLNLVEKLRMELSKKSNSNQSDMELTSHEEPVKKEEFLSNKSVQIRKEIKSQQIQELALPELEEKSITQDEPTPEVSKNHTIEEKRKSCYSSNSDAYVPYSNEDLAVGKVAIAERAKLDRAEADERWVPPSIDNFNPNDVQHINHLMESQNHRYTGHPFPNDISSVMHDNNTDTLVHPQININMPDQYQLMQQQHAIIRAHMDPPHSVESRPLQSIALINQQALPGALVDEIPPMEMINRHLMTSLPNVEEDQQNADIDRGLEKDDGSSDLRQDYPQCGSPYNDINNVRQDTRWAESQVLPSRRSTSSSITSASSTEEHTTMPPYKNISSLPFPPGSLETGPYNPFTESNAYARPVSLFPPVSCAASLPYPSPGTGMFPTVFGAPFPTPQNLLPHVPKPLEDALSIQASPCTAAFTSSSHNMALTAAMVSPTKIPTPPPAQPILPPVSQQEHTSEATLEPIQTQTSSPVLPMVFSNSNMSETPQVTEAPVEDVQEDVNTSDQKINQPGKKSPSKPTRTSARVTSLQGKSPGKSPRQEAPKSVTASRPRGRGSKSAQQGYRSRGRGRGRGRGRSNQNSHGAIANFSNTIYSDDSIQNKLVGTVYDFDSDEDSTNETNIADLKTMRERKKSTDVSEKREAPLSKDNMQSLSSPSIQKMKYDDKKLSSPLQETANLSESKGISDQTFTNTVLPLLPGPVDMRTYNSTVEGQTSSLHSQTFANHLLNLTGDSTVSTRDIEDALADFQSGLTAKPDILNAKASDPNDSSIEISGANVSDMTKMSLSDSRNQLKVKIKGPFLDANYVAASSVPPLAQQAPSIIPPSATSAAVASGTSNLRRMRKKELLRQYCSQDMNMADPTMGNIPSAPINIPPINRTVITIPKAIASMTSIPTREDYKAVVDQANLEKKRRKERGGGGFTETGEEETSDKRRMFRITTDRRRGRQPKTQPPATANSAPPKLKIKIGNNIMGQEEGSVQEDRSRIRPPKKRLSSIQNKPSIEELKRESMKFRKMIMAGFDNDDVVSEKSKKDKNGKKRKKQKGKEGRVQILDGGTSTTKLIIRLSKSNASANDLSSEASGSAPNDRVSQSEESAESRVGPPITEASKEDVSYPSDINTSEKQPVDQNTCVNPSVDNIRSAKLTPIRLKLTRCHEGYELKAPATNVTEKNVDKNNSGENVEQNQGKGSNSNERIEDIRQDSHDNGKEKPSKQEDIDILSQTTAAHTSPSCPPAPLPQGCQVR
ncbi:PHD finger protein rhinoceros [Chelonus insularis]|uniref:PHD finger protein rhinoceros n=1 Tax=Chelonus insularis TaxID=460826 RepID=UPI00158BB0FC|nr:PHD finger protein rhinoceros [Chelonus insularis]XP_034952501.1 PHD finger protein rhinoceros [Chelonus insularis]